MVVQLSQVLACAARKLAGWNGRLGVSRENSLEDRRNSFHQINTFQAEEVPKTEGECG